MTTDDVERGEGEALIPVDAEFKRSFARLKTSLSLLGGGIILLIVLGGPIVWALSLVLLPGYALWSFGREYREEGMLRRGEAVLSGALLLPSIGAGIALFTVWSPREQVVVELLLAITQAIVLVYFVARTAWSVREELVELFRSR
jgi:hypothetical protein